MNAQAKRVAVLGASGYAGSELCDRIEAHPGLQLAYAMSSREGVDPAKPELPVDRVLEPLDWRRLEGLDAVLLATPHGASAPLAAKALALGTRVVDLSADFRFPDGERYAEIYGQAHPHPELLDEAVYGLVEFERDRIASARLVAAPGCYPTSVLLALRPLIEAGLLDLSAPIIADCKSGASGAGKRPSAALHFGAVQDNFRAYSAGEHRHAPEIETHASGVGGPIPRLCFVPHLLPCFRGILSTIYATPRAGATVADARAALEQAYRGEAFVRVFASGQPELSRVVHTNQCHMAIASGRAHAGAAPGGSETWVLTSALDNLLKGAAGQALQALNLMLGFEEAEGLR